MTVLEGQAGLHAGGGLEALPRRLDAALRRVRADRLLATLTVATALALVAFGFLEFASVSFGLPIDLGGRIAVALILGLALAAVGTAADVFAWPGRLGIARRADVRFGLDERLSTAIEIASRGSDADAPVVARALLADAERRAGSLDLRALVKVPYGRYALAVAAAAVFAAISLAPPDYVPPRAELARPQPSTTLTATEVADTFAELRRVATIMQNDAARRDDPFLEALAREALRIGEEIEAGRLTDRDAVVAALDRLAGFTAEAYPPVAVPAPDYEESGGITERPAEATQILRDLARDRMTPPSATETAARTQDQPLVEPGDAAADIPPMMGLPPPTADVPNPQAPAGAEGQPPTGGAPGAADDEGYIEAAEMETYTDPTNYRAERTVGERPENAQLIGPADAANTGQSRFAGAGQQMLNGPVAEEDPFALGADMFLTGQIDETGRRIRIEVPPEIQAIAILPGEAAATEWTALREVEALRTGVPLGARDLLARYFRAAAEAE
ncbi:MAG: hypothetical protein KIT43_06905 [Bauldia sp.]|nr:hypothetical protein [Bauldia sp.]MCW5718421.1 hypothetical protein [Bauldia sp.]